MVSNQFSDILGQYGVERVPGVGAGLTPPTTKRWVASPPDAAPDSIVQEYEAGYTLHGRLLRPSKVVIAMEAPAAESDLKPRGDLKLGRFLESLPRSGFTTKVRNLRE